MNRVIWLLPLTILISLVVSIILLITSEHLVSVIVIATTSLISLILTLIYLVVPQNQQMDSYIYARHHIDETSLTIQSMLQKTTSELENIIGYVEKSFVDMTGSEVQAHDNVKLSHEYISSYYDSLNDTTLLSQKTMLIASNLAFHAAHLSEQGEHYYLLADQAKSLAERAEEYNAGLKDKIKNIFILASDISSETRSMYKTYKMISLTLNSFLSNLQNDLKEIDKLIVALRSNLTDTVK